MTDPEPEEEQSISEEATTVFGPSAGVGALMSYRYRDAAIRAGSPPPERGRIVDLPYASSDVSWRLGDYDITGELGKGGMGIVYRAWAVRLGREVALKVIRGEGLAESQVIRFCNEARLTAAIDHPGVVTVYDTGEIDGRHYIAMELVTGGDLGHLLKKEENGPPALDRWVRILAGAARAVHAAHELGLIHRDIKPGNILVDDGDAPRVVDFGLATETQREPGLTVTGTPVGTPHYMSPEQANAARDRVGPLSDVYALGATLYRIATGEAPFASLAALEVLVQVVLSEPDPPSRAAARNGRQVPTELEAICTKAMEKEATRRYPSAVALAEDLERWLDGRPVQARPLGALDRIAKRLRRRRAAIGSVIALVALASVLAASFGVLTLYSIDQTSEALRERDLATAQEQAATLEQAIRVNMLQGRADLSRDLVWRLSGEPQRQRVHVVRTDGKEAYTDLVTRKAVGRRLRDPQVREMVGRDFPHLVPRIEMLEKVGFANIDRAETRAARPIGLDRAAFSEAVRTGYVKTTYEEIDGTPMMTVLQPIRSAPECRVCHGRPEGGAAYGGYEPVRAVLVVRRSQSELEHLIDANRQLAWQVGGGTLMLLLLLGWLSMRLLGLRLPGRRFRTRT